MLCGLDCEISLGMRFELFQFSANLAYILNLVEQMSHIYLFLRDGNAGVSYKVIC